MSLSVVNKKSSDTLLDYSCCCCNCCCCCCFLSSSIESPKLRSVLIQVLQICQNWPSGAQIKSKAKALLLSVPTKATPSQMFVMVYVSLLFYTVLCRTIDDHIGLYRTVQDYAGLCRTVQDNTGLYRTIWDFKGLYITIIIMT